MSFTPLLARTMARTLAIAALASAAGFASAQTAASSPAKKELVQKVLQLQQTAIEGLGTQIANNTVQQMLQAAGRAMGNVPADKRELVANEIKADAKKTFDELNTLLKPAAVKAAPATFGAALEEQMSEDELKQLIVWLESPAAKKFTALGGPSLQTLSQKMMADNKAAVEPKIKALDQSIVKKLGLTPQPAASSASAKK